MGYIRGRHTSPGVYTKMTSINNVGASLYEKIKPLSTVNTTIPQVYGCFSYSRKDGKLGLRVSCSNVASLAKVSEHVYSFSVVSGRSSVENGILYLFNKEE